MSQKQICVNCSEGVYPEDQFCSACGEEQYTDPFDSISDVSTEPEYKWEKPPRPKAVSMVNLETGIPADLSDLTKKKKSWWRKF